MMVKSDVKNIFDNIKLLILDFQGVLVPEGASAQFYPKEQLNKLYRLCSKKGITLAVITSFEHIPEDFPNGIIMRRSTINKLAAAEKIIENLNIDLSETAFIADGILDIHLLQKSMFSGAPKNARREVKRVVDYLFNSEAGAGLIEEIIDLIFVGEPEKE